MCTPSRRGAEVHKTVASLNPARASSRLTAGLGASLCLSFAFWYHMFSPWVASAALSPTVTGLD